ncbi:MAG: hypothetical protein ACRCXY_03475 [Fusobacteriaceae bacterium]
MSINETSDIPEIDRKKLGNYIDEIRKEISFGFNQLSLKSGLNARTLNEILNGNSKRTNPYHLQKLGFALRIDYKELYKIVGYLSEDDFKEADLLKKEVLELKTKLTECENKVNVINHGEMSGNQILGNVNDSEIKVIKGEKVSNIDTSGLTEEQLKNLEQYIKFLRTQG